MKTRRRPLCPPCPGRASPELGLAVFRRRRPGGLYFSFFRLGFDVTERTKKNMKGKLGGEKRLKSLLLPPTAPRSEKRLLRVSEPRLFVETCPPRLSFKAKVRKKARDSPQFAVDWARVMPCTVELQ